MQDIDFAKLSLKDALDLAILIEDEAEERYREFVKQMEAHRTPGAARFFRFMAVNEANHGKELAKRRSALFGDAPCEVDRSMIFEVEAPDYDRTRAFMSMEDALELALDAETKAYQFFDQALPEIDNPEVRELFAELLQEEIEHMDLVKRVMAAVPEEPDFNPDDFVDAPVGE
ncbi:MAG TPA: ferritin family protein [Thermoanaerobaculales bacterium]|nr:ferritin family protein [Thermoanaerobaculales bacterium]HPA79805.1 ferritin family protein [Thermoanaerobaculales bacterium]HQL30918.1 ferritin family protein [Thermoanaerobaculales bacterium]HQN97000.1 ferritin family protein [Thermoanaerobaculales bacterium]HQP44316.1 ferritin family protein [Thermoanaerobaculales bacterium]